MVGYWQHRLEFEEDQRGYEDGEIYQCRALTEQLRLLVKQKLVLHEIVPESVVKVSGNTIEVVLAVAAGTSWEP